MSHTSDRPGWKIEAGKTQESSPIDLDSALERLMGDTDFLKNMLAHFSDSISSFLEDLRIAIGEKNAEALEKTAHQLKGAAVNLSLGGIAKSASAISLMGRQADFEKVEEAFSELEQAVREYQAFYTQFASET